jgi:hypothetical protein
VVSPILVITSPVFKPAVAAGLFGPTTVTVAPPLFAALSTDTPRKAVCAVVLPLLPLPFGVGTVPLLTPPLFTAVVAGTVSATCVLEAFAESGIAVTGPVTDRNPSADQQHHITTAAQVAAGFRPAARAEELRSRATNSAAIAAAAVSVRFGGDGFGWRRRAQRPRPLRAPCGDRL